MLKATPEDRVLMLYDAIRSSSEDRPARVRLVAKEAQESIAPLLDLYSHDELFQGSFELLAATGFLGRDDLRIALEEPDSYEAALRFADVVSQLLVAGAEDPHLEAEQRDMSWELVQAWQEILADPPHPHQDTRIYLSVAEVADHFGVTPQAVYRWVDKDKIQWRRRPGGSLQIPAEQFDDIDVDALTAATRRRALTPDARLHMQVRAGRQEDGDDHMDRVDPRDPLGSVQAKGSKRRSRPLRRRQDT